MARPSQRGFSFDLDCVLIEFTSMEESQMIAHFPGVISAKSDDLNSLDLIFAPFRRVHCFAIRCHIPDNEQPMYLLLGPEFFDDIEEPVLQSYIVGVTVLSFGQDYRFDLDVTPETVAHPNNPEVSTGLVIYGDQSYFRFVYEPGSDVRRMNLLDLATGEVIPDLPHGETTTIKRWGISVGLGAEEKPVVVIPKL